MNIRIGEKFWNLKAVSIVWKYVWRDYIQAGESEHGAVKKILGWRTCEREKARVVRFNPRVTKVFDGPEQ